MRKRTSDGKTGQELFFVYSGADFELSQRRCRIGTVLRRQDLNTSFPDLSGVWTAALLRNRTQEKLCDFFQIFHALQQIQAVQGFRMVQLLCKLNRKNKGPHLQYGAAADGSACNNTDKNLLHILGIHRKAAVLLYRKESVLPFCSSCISTLCRSIAVFPVLERHKAKRESGPPAAIVSDTWDARESFLPGNACLKNPPPP